MKNIKLTSLILFASLLLTNCTNVLDKTINAEDFPKVKELISKSDTLKEMEKNYIIDQIAMYTGFSTLGDALKIDKSNMANFRKAINESSQEFREKEKEYLTNIENNKKIRELISLIEAKATPISIGRGYLSMKLKGNNKFKKDILYIILNYKYTTKYDTEYFNQKVKITDKVAKDFNGEIEANIKENYNDVAEFMYSKVPTNEKKNKAKMMEGLKVETTLVVFKDKTELSIQPEEWKYLKK